MKIYFYVLFFLFPLVTTTNASNLEWANNTQLKCQCYVNGYPRFVLSCEGGYQALFYGHPEGCTQGYEKLVTQVQSTADKTCQCVRRADLASRVEFWRFRDRNLSVRGYKGTKGWDDCLREKSHLQFLGECLAD